MNKHFRGILEGLYFTAKVVSYAYIWGAAILYFGDSSLDFPMVVLFVSGIVSGLGFIFMPSIRKVDGGRT